MILIVMSCQVSPGMFHPAPPRVGREGVVGLVSQSGAVLVCPPHPLRYVQVQPRVEVHLVKEREVQVSFGSSQLIRVTMQNTPD